MMHDLGDTVGLAVAISDGAGDPADAGAVTLTVTQPDGTTAAPTVLHPSVGRYAANFAPTQPGRHSYRFVATGANASAYTDTFTVADPAAAPAVSLSEVKAHLNITTTTNDEELRALIGGVNEIGESYTGRVFGRRTVVDTITGDGMRYLLLSACPVLAVSSVTLDGAPLPDGDYRINPAAATMTRPAGWTDGAEVEVTYLAGYRTQPGADVQGALRMIAHLWKYQRGSVQARGGSWSDEAPFAVPNFVAELWDLNRLTGFA